MGAGAVRKKKLALISTYDELCGIAGYSHKLVEYLAHDFDIEVFPLDQDILRFSNSRLIRLGDEHIRAIASRLGEFDAVNIQYEPGTLGPTNMLARKRLFRLLDASPAYSVTFHTFFRSLGLPIVDALKATAKGKPAKAVGMVMDQRREHSIGHTVYKKMIRDARTKQVSFIVHTKRDAQYLRLNYGAENVFAHPLAFLTPETAKAAAGDSNRDNFPSTRNLPEDVKLIGVFGFISPYKGTLTAVRALRHLPDNYHLLIFGGLHPNAIQRNMEIDDYLEKVVAEVNGVKVDDVLNLTGSKKTKQLGQSSLSGFERLTVENLMQRHSDLSDRVHFMGSLNDDDFVKGMALCDYTAFPYLEVGQSSSGPISMAIELGRPVIAARNHAFRQLAKFHKGRLDFFEIGNHMELADRVLNPFAQADVETPFSTRTNRAIYREAHGLPANAEQVAGPLPEPRVVVTPTALEERTLTGSNVG